MAMAPDIEAGHRPRVPDSNEVARPLIVVGLDGSPSSWDAFCWAAGEAARQNGKVVAVYVVPTIDAGTVFGVTLAYTSVEPISETVASELKTEAASRADELGVALDFITEHGDVTHVLTDVARELHAKLVVVGRSTKMLHRLTGSLSHRLTSRTDAPVVVVVP
jgi:nucleotide-binding universal stress UspA family protein